MDTKELAKDPKHILQKLESYKTKITQMDNKVRDYVLDRENKRHPWPNDLIEEIRRYENQIHTIPNTEVQMKLDGLMHTLLIYQRIWTKAIDRVS